MTEMRVVSTSSIANMLVPGAHSNSSTANIKFGKIFEECYTQATYLHNKISCPRIIPKAFARKIAIELKLKGLPDKQLVQKAYRMYACLLKAKVFGRKPKTEFRMLNDKIMIAAQPDLEAYGAIYEFKTYPIDEFARIQTSIFSWVFQLEIILVGLVADKEGYYSSQLETIPPIRKEVLEGINYYLIGEFQNICKDCERPERSCACW